jgi:hypothetical protein
LTKDELKEWIKVHIEVAGSVKLRTKDGECYTPATGLILIKLNSPDILTVVLQAPAAHQPTKEDVSEII